MNLLPGGETRPDSFFNIIQLHSKKVNVQK